MRGGERSDICVQMKESQKFTEKYKESIYSVLKWNSHQNAA